MQEMINQCMDLGHYAAAKAAFGHRRQRAEPHSDLPCLTLADTTARRLEDRKSLQHFVVTLHIGRGDCESVI